MFYCASVAKLKPKSKPSFVRCTVNLPRELMDYVDKLKMSPQHAGSQSSCVRWIILEHRSRSAPPEAAK